LLCGDNNSLLTKPSQNQWIYWASSFRLSECDDMTLRIWVLCA